MQTRDIVLAASLVEHGIQLNGITMNGAQATFHIDDGEDLDKLVAEFHLGQLRVEPRSFHARIRNLSSSIKTLKDMADKKS